ncbi:hypothetical protein AMPC_27450 [Anaeromyxobacter paludicola]|uniref:Diacylglycerol kinase n=1 Tax=Anaeromyxobacter paludicola TaxID=2918171 RepID=A0ABN6N8S7_9BACT|nr:hypothetical protein AMPC_27450 [Anaeromyxobacter paludicola]
MHAVAHERNMKLHVAAGLAVGLAGGCVALPLAAQLGLLLCVALVLAAEAFNTALEALVDLCTTELRREARIAKDAAAGAVLALAAGAVLAGAAVVARAGPALSAARPRLGADAAIGAGVLAAAGWLLGRGHASGRANRVATALGGALLAGAAHRTVAWPFTGLAVALFALAAAAAARRSPQVSR